MFSNFITCCTTKYIQFSGRANRKEFWSFILLFLIEANILLILSYAFGEYILEIGKTLSLCLALIVIISLFYSSLLPLFAVTTRRLHDLNISGKWIILPIIFSIFFLYTIFFADNAVMTDWLKKINLIIYIGFLIILGFKGKVDSNQFDI